LQQSAEKITKGDGYFNHHPFFISLYFIICILL